MNHASTEGNNVPITGDKCEASTVSMSVMEASVTGEQ